jgi:hypothetical protein
LIASTCRNSVTGTFAAVSRAKAFGFFSHPSSMVMKATFCVVAMRLSQAADSPRGNVIGTAAGGGANAGTRRSSALVNATAPGGRGGGADGGPAGSGEPGAEEASADGPAPATNTGRGDGELPQPAITPSTSANPTAAARTRLIKSVTSSVDLTPSSPLAYAERRSRAGFTSAVQDHTAAQPSLGYRSPGAHRGRKFRDLEGSKRIT